MLKIIKKIHNFLVHTNRVDTIANTIIQQLPSEINKILDIGCGDGLISKLIVDSKVGIEYDGIDIMERPICNIRYTSFDGVNIPFEPKSFDAVQLIDVLHHTEDVDKVLKNALNYTSKYLIIKDHIYKSKLDFFILKFMDWVGNAPHGVDVIYNFQTEENWNLFFQKNKLKIKYINKRIKLYPWYANWIFGQKLHFIAILELNQN